MLIGIVGAPGSGKTTLAASLFAYFKQQSHVVEFVSERARKYIAEQKFSKGKNISLSDPDQLNILFSQHYEEKMFVFSTNKNDLVLSDSSWINALGYMSDEFRETCIHHYLTALHKYDLIIFANVFQQDVNDLNRIHSFQQSKQIEKILINLLRDHRIAKYFDKIVFLNSNDIYQRYDLAKNAICKKANNR